MEDAGEACQVVRRSIAELCHADHQDDPIVLEKWLSNNTSHNMRSWIADPDTYVIVATEGAAIIGVGAITSSGDTLNYVSPDIRFRGIAKQRLELLNWATTPALLPAHRLPAAFTHQLPNGEEAFPSRASGLNTKQYTFGRWRADTILPRPL